MTAGCALTVTPATCKHDGGCKNRGGEEGQHDVTGEDCFGKTQEAGVGQNKGKSGDRFRRRGDRRGRKRRELGIDKEIEREGETEWGGGSK